MADRNFYTAADIELLSNQGIKQLDLRENDVVTAIAYEVAEKHGIKLNFKTSDTYYNKVQAKSFSLNSRAVSTGNSIQKRIFNEANKILSEGPETQNISTPKTDSKVANPREQRQRNSAQPDDWMMRYRIFLDTADIAQIRDAVSTGLIDGIATNPHKIAESKKSYRQVIEDIRQYFDGPIAVQAVGQTVEEVCQVARQLHTIDPLLAIKITANKVGLAAVKILVSEGVRTNATLMFNPTQALLAALAGSPFISPFIGRAKMTGQEGIDAIAKMRKLMDAFNLNRTNLISASVKDVDQVIESIIAGANSVAVTFTVFESMCEHPLTSQGLDDFINIYKTIPKS